ncbi:hypothetical protein ACP70R_012046 [Stipagrostis hirtigluma subsp. patula]
MAGVLHLWNEWEIQILVLVSFALQVLLLMFGRMRRRSISRVLRILLWLMYLMADATATYTLGHMSISCTPAQQHQLRAFWAPFLLVHLGGQDTITAYAMEDNQLWLRHLFTLFVQALGAAYILYKNIGSRGPLVAPAVLMFLIGILKNGERVWALSASRLEIIRKILSGVSIKQKDGPYSACTQFVEAKGLDAESVLQGAQDLLYICMGQFVDDKIWPSKFQNDAIKLFHEKSSTFELIEMQLSLMYDIFYTKAAVIHTWYGCCIRAISLVGTVIAFFLFQFSTGKDGYNRVDTAVTYTLVIGAFILEIASVLRAVGSTWTCATLNAGKWDWLHNLHVSVRRFVRIAQTRRWLGSTGQLNLLDSYTSSAGSLRSKVISFWRNGSSKMSIAIKKLVLEEILRMAKECNGNEDVMRSYRGQCALKQPDGCFKDDTWSLPDGFLDDLTWSTEMEFDQSVLAWHLATEKFLSFPRSANEELLVEATRALSNYMMFLVVERPYMLPSPVRPTLYLKARQELLVRHWWFTENYTRINNDAEDTPVLNPGAKLATELLCKESEMPEPVLLQVVFGVWVEMLCYAAHHCSRESHARQLNNGGELITIVWLLTTSEFNRVYYSEKQFKERKHGSFWNFMNFMDFMDFGTYIMMSLYGILVFIYSIFFCISLPFKVIYCFLKPPRRGAILREICLS